VSPVTWGDTLEATVQSVGSMIVRVAQRETA
jgi:hypothetical protein